MTSARRPVRITASVGTRNADSPPSPCRLTWAVNPGRSLPSVLGSSTRTRSARASPLSVGNSAVTRPGTGLPGNAAKAASAVCPTRTDPAWDSGTATSSHTVPMPLICASVCPAITVMPARTSRVWITPPRGAVIAMRFLTLPLAATARIRLSGMPASRIRSRAAPSNEGSPSALSARYSCCTAAHSGTSSSAMKAPDLMTSFGARLATRSTKPPVRACTMATSRALKSTIPVACTAVPTVVRVTVARRTPRFCDTLGSIFTAEASPPSSAYLGTSSMSMKGDLPGLSNFCMGTIGSYQYSTLGPSFAASVGMSIPPPCT